MSTDREKIARKRQRRRRRRLKASFKIFIFFFILIVGGGTYLGVKYYQSQHAPDPYGVLEDVPTPDDSGYNLSDTVMSDAKYWIIDVGDGEAIFIQCEQTDILIDTGSDEKAKAVLDTVKGELKGGLDYLLITSTSERRTGGLKKVCAELKPEKIISCPLGDKEKEIKAAIGGKEIEDGTNKTLALTENGSLTIFLPEVSSTDPLDQSLMTFFKYGDTSFFAESDAGEEEEARVIEQIGQCDVFVLARGGSHKVNQHIDEVRCQTYIASCDKDARPAAELLERTNGTFFATCNSGTIRFTTNGVEVQSDLDQGKKLTAS